MTAITRNIIQSFELLTESEKKDVASEIIRRSLKLYLPPLSDKEFVLNAEELFLELEKNESNIAKVKSCKL